MIKAILFDIGGVLIEDPKVRDFWKGQPFTKELREKFGSGKMSINKFISKGSQLLGISKEKFLEGYKKAYFNLRLIQPVFNIYKKIKLDKYILCDSNPLHMKYIKDKFKMVLQASKETFFSPEIGSRKSEEKTFKFIIKKLNLKPKEILLIDNLENCLYHDKKLGINVIMFKNHKQLIKDLKKFGVKI